MTEDQVVVLDIGSSNVRAGLASEAVPEVVYPTVCGKPLWKFRRQSSLSTEVKESYVGSAAISNRDILSLCYPIQDGVVQNYDDFLTILTHTFHDELKISPEDYPVILAETPLCPKQGREKCTELFFESLYVPSLYLANQAALSLIAAGRETGVVLMSGENVTMIVPVYQYTALNYAICRSEVAGKQLTKFLTHLLNLRDIAMPQTDDIKQVKEKLCYVAMEYADELGSDDLEERHSGSNGMCVTVAEERFRCPELLFQPSLGDIRSPGVHEALESSVLKCADDLEEDMYRNIVLSGGNTMFQGFGDRLRAELEDIEPEMNIKVCAPSTRMNSPWVGGAILAGMPSFSGMCVTKSEYDEVGVSIVHRKCF